jgi:hypothetical protein
VIAHFSAGKKKPAEAGFPKTMVDSLSEAFLADGRSSVILKRFLCFS